ncbi:hypothetical protein AXF42_Ash020068 [Apostasia shenzhenica]|uniref:Retrotransposon gag domain-containing protein n=1 Tax=Apostasia shenzhenica TaxID=1088818 RepID=A0A2I0B4S4_9ASPA|nr:hypothetical protein AXF42_Ash020068 [Apostasia shenzhenica]
MDGNAPFSDAIRLAPIPEDFRPPRLEVYKGVIDPREHVQGFEAAVRYRQPDKATRCHLLANTLKGAAFSWFIKLPRGHISSYEHLKWELIACFIGRTRMVVSDMVLANIKQGERESLRNYTNRFFAAAAEAEDVELAVAMHDFRRGLNVGDLSKSLQLAKSPSYPELVARASQFMLLEDVESFPTSAPGVKQVVACITDFDVRRVLLDSGSAVDILFESSFLQMGLKEANLLCVGTTLLGFYSERVQPLGFITLPVSFGDENGHAMSMVNFAVIRAKSGYNAILGRTTLNSFGMVIFTPHLCAKFPTSSGGVTIRGDTRQATHCFQIAAQLVVDQMDPRETQSIIPQEGVISVALGGENSSKIINISSYLNDKQQTEVIALLSEYIDVFAWSPEDVTCMDRAVCEHHLNVSQAVSPIVQKKRVMAGERQDAIREEINKLLGAGYIREV